MLKIITIISYVLCFLGLNVTYAEAPEAQYPSITLPKTATVQEIINQMSDEYNLSPQMMSEVIFCESSFNENATHDGGRGKGITGFHRATFLDWEKKSGMDLNYDSTFDQIKLMSWAFSQGEKYRDDWTSYNRYKKYGTCKVSEIKKIEKRAL